MPKKKNKNKKRIDRGFSTSSSSKNNTTNNKNLEINESTEISETKKINNLKSPICCFLGHVDAGKTSLMDVVRNTSIAKNEAGGITQSIGSSFISINDIKVITNNIKGKFKVEHQIPGLLVVDTPGHAAFSNLRQRGSSLCDMAILVIDILDGVKPQTIESIKILKDKKVPFVIAATKIDMIYGWQKTNEYNLRKVLKKQDENTNNILTSHLLDLEFELKNQGVNAKFYFQNNNTDKIYSIIPVSSKTKEGLSDLLSFLVYLSQNWMNKKITYRDTVRATIMESTRDKKLGWIIDIILSNGTIKIGDKFAVYTKSGPKMITIRNLMIINNNKISYHESVRASAGIRVIASNLEKCFAGTHLHFKDSENDSLKAAEEEIESFWKSLKLTENGVNIQAPTFGELEAVYNILNEENINISGTQVNTLTLNQKDSKNNKDIDIVEARLESVEEMEYRCLLYFGKLSQKEKDEFDEICKLKNIKFISSEVVYTLVEEYKKFTDNNLEFKQEQLSLSGEAIFPCKLKILDDKIFMKGGTDDLMFGVKVLAGELKKGTPLFATIKKKFIGNVVSIKEFDKKGNAIDTNSAKIHKQVCIRLKKDDYVLYDRHFDSKDLLVPNMTRESIDILKKYFRPKLSMDDWKLTREIKELLLIN